MNNNGNDFMRIADKTEIARRAKMAELNVGRSREELEALYGKVYSTDELRLGWEVQAFTAPLVVVKSRADGGLGSFEFQHSPRFYFNHVKDEE